MAAVRHDEFRNLEFMSRDFYRHAILLPFAINISLKSDNRLAAELWPKPIFQLWPSSILNFKNVYIWSSAWLSLNFKRAVV